MSGAAQTAAAGPGPDSATAELSRDEWTAVLLSLGDGRRSLRAVQARGRLGRVFLGNRRPAHLTSARLEALRRYAILHRLQGTRLSDEEAARLRGTGFSDRQAAAVRAIVDSFHAPSRPAGAERPARTAMAALLAMGAIGAVLVILLDRWLSTQLDDPLGALIISILVTTGFVSFLSVAGHPHGGRRPRVTSGPKRTGRPWAALAFAVILGLGLIPLRPATAAPVEGIWQNRNGTLEVQVAPCGPKYCGTVVGARGQAVADAREGGMTRLVGSLVMKDYAPAPDGSWHGSVFVPKLGRHLSSRLTFVDANNVRITACALGGLICRDKMWRRLPAHLERASLASGK